MATSSFSRHDTTLEHGGLTRNNLQIILFRSIIEGPVVALDVLISSGSKYTIISNCLKPLLPSPSDGTYEPIVPCVVGRKADGSVCCARHVK